MRSSRCVGLTAFAVLAISCTWTRFDDVTDNPPVERFEAPTSTSGLGTALAAYVGTAGTSLVAAASDRVVLYDVGSSDNPSLTAMSSQSCVGDNSCVLSRRLSAIKSQALTDNLGCVAYGMGTVTESSGASSGKLWLYCDGADRRSLDLPATLQTWLASRALTTETSFYVATPRNIETPALVAALPDASMAWFYTGLSATAIELPSLPDGKKVGRSLAVMPHESSYTIAASSMTTDEVWLFEVDSTGVAALTGCISGPPQFGRLLASGKFSATNMESLLVADTTTVYAIPGSSLILPQPNGTPSCIDITSTELIAKAGCSSFNDVNACGSQPFASAIMAANLDGSGVDELVVGVGEAVVRGEGAAGAVLTYTLDNGSFKVKDGLFVSSAASGDRLGTSIAAIPTGQVERIAAGAPGDNSVMEFFCNSLVPAALKAARCP